MLSCSFSISFLIYSVILQKSIYFFLSFSLALSVLLLLSCRKELYTVVGNLALGQDAEGAT